MTTSFEGHREGQTLEYGVWPLDAP